MRLQVISDGTRSGTKIVNENGEEVDGVTKVEWNFTQNDGVWATFTISDAPCRASTAEPVDDVSRHIL